MNFLCSGGSYHLNRRGVEDVQDRLASVRKGRFKLIHPRHGDEAVLYDLEADPSEKVDLSGVHTEVFDELSGALEVHRRGLVMGTELGPITDLERSRLEALGYL